MTRRKFLHIFRYTTAGVMTLLTGSAAAIFAGSLSPAPGMRGTDLAAEISCVLGGVIWYLLFAVAAAFLCPSEEEKSGPRG